MPAVDAWGYSRWSLYEKCPFAFKCKHIDKLHEEQGPAAARGDRIHKEAEAYVKAPQSVSPELPDSLHKFSELFNQIRMLPPQNVYAEQQWGFTSSWRPTGYFTKGPPAVKTWLRVKCDLAIIYPDHTADVVDHKTGKAYDDHAEQMELNSLVTLCKFPQVEVVTNRLWYIDSGAEVVDTFTADQRSAAIAKWNDRVGRMFSDTVFAPRPNDKCGYCAYSRSNGGPCRFG